MATGGAASSRPPPQQTRKLQNGLNELAVSPLSFLRDLELSFVDGVNQLTGILLGPDGSDYAGGHFRFIIQFPPEYPFKILDFSFATAMCHPNVDSRTGQVCHDQLIATWEPKLTLKQVFIEIHALLANPVYDTSIEDDPLPGKSPTKAREWTQSFAQP